MPQFKPGDFVRVFGRPTVILRVEGTSEEPEYYDTRSGYRDGCLNTAGLEPWEPNIGEKVIYDGNLHTEIRRYSEDLKKEAYLNYEARILPLTSYVIENLKI